MFLYSVTRIIFIRWFCDGKGTLYPVTCSWDISAWFLLMPRFHLENCPGVVRGGTGGIWILWGAWWLKRQSFTNATWEGGQGMLEYMCAGFYTTGFRVLGGSNSKVRCWRWGVYSIEQLGGSGVCSSRFFFFFNRCSEIDSEAFWGY